MIIEVKVKASAKNNEVRELPDGSFEVRVKDAPEKGKANAKVIKLLSKRLHISTERISLKTGGSSKNKLFKIDQ